MNKLIFQHETNKNKKSLIIWTLVSVGVMILFMALFPLLEKMMAEMIVMMEPMYESMGIEIPENMMAETTAVGYFASEIGGMYLLASMIFAAIVGITAWSKEESKKTAEFLLTTPVNRENVWKSKLVSSIVVIAIFGIIFSIASFITVLIFSSYSSTGIVWGDMVGLIIFLLATNIMQLIVVSFCYGLGFFFKKTPSMGIAFLIVFGMLLLQILTGIAQSVAKTDFGLDIIHALYFISPFSVVDPMVLIGLTGKTFTTPLTDLWYIVGSLAIWVTATILINYYSVKKFQKRDIPN